MGKDSKTHRIQKLTPEQIDEFYQIFKLLDTNNDGFIDAKELDEMFQNVREQYTDAEIKDILKMIDINCDQKISFTEFIKFMKQYCDKNFVETAKEVFKLFDSDHDGFLTVEELCNALSKFDHYHDLVKQDIEEIFTRFDINKDGLINFEGS